jgi:hypothetical protein
MFLSIDFSRENAPRQDPALMRRRSEEVRLALLLNHPFLLNEQIEDIAGNRFHDRELDRLLAEILRIHGQKPDLDAAALKFHLSEIGLTAIVNRVLSPQVLNHAASARFNADPETVRDAWSELAGQIEQLGLSNDVAAAARDLADDMSLETWQRLHPLFERKGRG